MLLKDFAPAPDVQSFVELFRIIHLKFDAGQDIGTKAYPPRPEHCLAFYPYDTETVTYQQSQVQIKHIPIVLYGQFTEVTHRMIGRNFLVFQVIFYPGALFRLTGIPANELNNEYLDARQVFGTSLNEINEQLFHAPDYHAMLNIVNGYIRSLITSAKKPRINLDDEFISLLKGKEPVTIQRFADTSYNSIKQVERKFKERTGVNPKLYLRIMRFDRAFRTKNANPSFDWLRIAMHCGYHDYQHLAKEYKDFTGLSPTAFHQIEDKAPERTFGLIEGYD